MVLGWILMAMSTGTIQRLSQLYSMSDGYKSLG
jgi:hypothetical protein